MSTDESDQNVDHYLDIVDQTRIEEYNSDSATDDETEANISLAREVEASIMDNRKDFDHDLNQESSDSRPTVKKHAQPLTSEEIDLIRESFRSRMLSNTPKKTARKEFKVPREHPVFSGNPQDLEPFLMEMELVHGRETNPGTRHDPHFITKLVSYFKDKSAAKSWFKMYATSCLKKNLHMSWKQLVRDLRKNYGAYDQPRSRFEEYYEMKQTGNIHTYIAQKAEAALHTSDLNEKTELYGFIRGLKEKVQNYVNLQRPNNLKEAQEYAVAFENSLSNKGSKRKGENDEETDVKKKSRTEDSKRKTREKGSLDNNKKEALKEIRKLRENACFICGKSGHSRDACDSSHEIKKAFQAKIQKLKETLNEK